MGLINGCIKISKSIWNSHPMQNFMKDLRSLRALWCWIFLVLFVISYGYIVYVNHDSHDTALTVLGGLVGWIFSNYVISKGVDNFHQRMIENNGVKRRKSTEEHRENEEGA